MSYYYIRVSLGISHDFLKFHVQENGILQEWDIEAPPEDIKEFMQHAMKYLRNSDKRMKSIAAKSMRELRMQKPRS